MGRHERYALKPRIRAMMVGGCWRSSIWIRADSLHFTLANSRNPMKRDCILQVYKVSVEMAICLNGCWFVRGLSSLLYPSPHVQY